LRILHRSSSHTRLDTRRSATCSIGA
jgi:hypothetical protein